MGNQKVYLLARLESKSIYICLFEKDSIESLDLCFIISMKNIATPYQTI
jgi:hypothetical protein